MMNKSYIAMKKILKPLLFSLVLGSFTVLLISLLPYVKIIDIFGKPILIFWYLVFVCLFYLFFSTKKVIFLLILPLIIYLLAYVGYFPQNCSCTSRFEWKPIHYEPICDFLGCTYEVPLTSTQKYINLILLKEIPEIPEGE